MRDLETLLAPAHLGAAAAAATQQPPAAGAEPAALQSPSVPPAAAAKAPAIHYRSVNAVLRTSDHAPVDAVFNLRATRVPVLPVSVYNIKLYDLR